MSCLRPGVRLWKLIVISVLVCCFVYYCEYATVLKSEIKSTRFLYLEKATMPPTVFVVTKSTDATFESGKSSPTTSEPKISTPSSVERHTTTSVDSRDTQTEIGVTEAFGKYENCTPRQDIMFLKTHKTASSAVQNILLRYGSHHNLTFALPHNKHDFGYPGLFHTNSVHNPKGLKILNILCHHMRLNYADVSKVMPPNTFYLSIVREPGALFESMFDYLWDLVPAFMRVGHGEPPEKWLDNAEEHFRLGGRRSYWFFAKNAMMYDFGYNNVNEDETYIKNSIQEIEERFDLILIADYYEESMVLLSDALCWSLEEVACLSLNARTRGEVDLEAKSRLSEKARRWNRADAALFDHFNATLWKKIEAFGFDRMREKLNELEQIKGNLTEMCIEGGKAVDSSKITDPKISKYVFKPRGVAVSAYNLKKGEENNSFCRELIMPENAFNGMVFDRQVNG